MNPASVIKSFHHIWGRIVGLMGLVSFLFSRDKATIRASVCPLVRPFCPIRVRGPWHVLKVPCSISCKLTSRLCYLQLPNHSALVLQESSSFILISNRHPVWHFKIVYTNTREYGCGRIVFNTFVKNFSLLYSSRTVNRVLAHSNKLSSLDRTCTG